MAAPIQYPAIFNGNDLAKLVPGLQVYNINTYVLPHRVLNTWQVARSNGQKVSSAFWDKRVITISVYIGRDSRATLDQSLDKLYSLIQAQEAPLIVPQSGTVRQYTATFDSHIHNSPRTGASTQPSPQGGHIDLTLNFVCSDSYGYDTNYSVIVPNGTAYTSGNVVVPYTQGGGADTQAPHIEIKFTGATANTGTVQIGNQNTGQVISVTNTFNQYDILTVDVLTKTVQINGVDVVFSGAFPEVGIGLQSLYYLDNFTSRAFNMFAYVYNRWN